MVRPCSSSESYTSPRRGPVPTVATPPEKGTERIGSTSTTIPLVEEYPAKQCPPLRVAVLSPDRLANEIVSETSAGVHHCTTTCGRTSWKRAMAGLRLRGLESGYADKHRAGEKRRGTSMAIRLNFGDFRKLHRSALVATKQHAGSEDYKDVQRAADWLLQMLPGENDE
jgi:hypothetical protein